MSNSKEKRILQFLIKHKERFVTSKELAEHISCSDRTVRNTLKLIDQTMNIQGVKLISKQGRGFQLFFENQEAYQEFRLTYELGEVYSTTSISKGDDRLAFILNKLLFEQVPVLFDDLADELYVSRSTLSHDFKKIRRMLSEYDLSIESRANKGVYVSGEERDKRCFIMDYFLSNQFLKTLHCHVQSNFFDQTISLEEIARIVLEECQDAKLKLSDFVLQNLVVHIALAIVRIKSGFEIKNLSCQMSNNDTERKAYVVDFASGRLKMSFTPSIKKYNVNGHISPDGKTIVIDQSYYAKQYNPDAQEADYMSSAVYKILSKEQVEEEINKILAGRTLTKKEKEQIGITAE